MAWSKMPRSNALLPKCQWRNNPYKEYAAPKSAAATAIDAGIHPGSYPHRGRPILRSMLPVRRLLGYVARYRRSFLLGLACVIATTAVTLAGPWVLKYAIDDLAADVTAAKVRLYAVALLALAAVGGAFRFLMRRIIIGASRDIEYDMRNDFFAALQRLELSFFHQRRTGDLMSRATNDLGSVRQMIGPAVMYTSTTALTFVVAITMMLSIDARLTLIALLPLPFVSIAVYYFGNQIHRRFLKIQEQLSEISAVAQENLSGVRVVRAYGQEPFEIERFRAANVEYVRRNRGLVAVQGLYFPSMGLLMGVAMLIVLWLGSRRVVAGQMTVGELVAFNAYLVMLSWPMIAFGWVTNLIQRGMASWQRMLEVLDAVPAINDDLARAHSLLAPIRGDIEFRNLTFKHGDRVILDRVSATIPAGTTTAIVGATGSGKSTLLHVLPRLHDAPPGTVFVDGVDVRHIPLPVLRGAIGFVPQEPFLFSATIADNIAFGARGDQARRERVEEAARIARLDKDLGRLPERVRHGRRRARDHAVGRSEAAHRARTRHRDRPADPDPRRRAVGGGHLHRGGDPRNGWRASCGSEPR